MINAKYNFIRALFLLMTSGVYFKNFRTIQVRSPDDAEGVEFYALDFLGLISQYGRKGEWHNVTTEDGYILSVFRIPPNRLPSSPVVGNPVIFLQHGVIGTADSFVIMDSTRSPAYLLSDAGYDVWLGNLRGNTYSRRHMTLSPDNPKFWNFSIDEYATSDLPAMLDYVMMQTKQHRISYMGHSLGTTIMMMLLSERPDYNEKLRFIVLLAPIAFWTGRSAGTDMGLLMFRLLRRLRPAGDLEVLPQNNLLPFLFKYVCSINELTMEACVFPVETIFGRDREQIDSSMMRKFITYYPGAASAKVFYHYMQHIDNGDFRRYDYSDDHLNLQHYGRTEAPLYNLSNIRTPVVAVHSLNDPLSSDEQVEYLLRQLGNNKKVIYHVIDNENFNHLDFLIGKDAKNIIYDQLIEIMSQFDSNNGCGNVTGTDSECRSIDKGTDFIDE